MKGTVHQLRSLAIAALGVMLLSPAGAEARRLTLTQTLRNPEAAGPHFGHEGSFGISVAISGDNVLVGAPGTLSDFGAAHLFDAATGNPLHTFLTPSEGFPGPDFSLPGQGFGNSVAISGDNVLVGAPGAQHESDSSSGAALLFDAATGNLLQAFVNPTPAFNERFGGSVAISGDNFLVGVPKHDAGHGAAYLYGPNKAMPWLGLLLLDDTPPE